MKRTTAALAVLSAAALGTFAVALPAIAEDSPGVIYPVVDWEILDWPVGTDPVPATFSGISDDCSTLVLDKPNVPSNGDPAFPPGSNGDIGTDFSTSNLDLEVNAGDFILVDYQLYDFDNAAAGAVRMFAYAEPDASTEGGGTGDSPWQVAIVPGDTLNGTLEIEFPTDAAIGTFGITYDASNDTEDYVTFTNLRYDNHSEITPISFCNAPEPPVTETVTESPSPSPSVTTTTTTTTTTTPPATTDTTTTSTETSTTTTTAASTTTTSVVPASLAVTGSGLFPKMIGIGTGLIVLGAAALIIVARRFRDEEQPQE